MIVLIVYDNYSIANTVENLLQQQKYEIYWLSNAIIIWLCSL